MKRSYLVVDDVDAVLGNAYLSYCFFLLAFKFGGQFQEGRAMLMKLGRWFYIFVSIVLGSSCSFT